MEKEKSKLLVAFLGGVCIASAISLLYFYLLLNPNRLINKDSYNQMQRTLNECAAMSDFCQTTFEMVNMTDVINHLDNVTRAELMSKLGAIVNGST